MSFDMWDAERTVHEAEDQIVNRTLIQSGWKMHYKILNHSVAGRLRLVTELSIKCELDLSFS